MCSVFAGAKVSCGTDTAQGKTKAGHTAASSARLYYNIVDSDQQHGQCVDRTAVIEVDAVAVRRQ